MMIRIRSRDGLERVKVDNPNTTVSQFKTLIENQLQIPTHNQTLSTNQNLLLAKSQDDLLKFTDMSNPSTPLSALSISHGSIVFLAYEGERTVAGPAVCPAGSFGRKMTMDDLIAKQMKVTRQENAHCELISFDRDCANAFQHYVNETLAFAVKRGGFMYGTVSEEGKVEVNFIYEPPQQGTEENLLLLRDPEEEKMVEAIAIGLGMRKVGFIFTQTISQDKKDYTLSNREVLQAVQLHAEGELKEWVTAVVKLEVNDDGAADVHFEAFQLSDMCVRLFKEGWLETEIGPDDDPKLSKMKKDVVVGVKDTKEVDNDFFLVLVKIFDHQGPLSSTFPIENRITPVTMRALKNHLDRTKSLPFVKRISPGLTSLRPLPPPPGLALNMPRVPPNTVQYSAPGGLPVPPPMPLTMQMMPSVRPPTPPMSMTSGQQPTMMNRPRMMPPSMSMNPSVPPPPGSQYPPMPVPRHFIPLPVPPPSMSMMPPPPLPQGMPPPPPPEEAPPPLPEEPEPKRLKLDDSLLVPEDQFLAQHPGPVRITISVPNVDEGNLKGQLLEITVQSLSETVGSLKEKIAGEIQLPSNKQKLSGKAGFLKDNITLAYYNVGSGETLSLSLRERGGRKR